MSDIKQRLRDEIAELDERIIGDEKRAPVVGGFGVMAIIRLESRAEKAATLAEIERLEARVAELGQSLRRSIDNEVALRADRAAARAEAEALRKDAERYRWLRNDSLGQWEHPIVVSQARTPHKVLYVGPLCRAELDAAVDAAREGGK